MNTKKYGLLGGGILVLALVAAVGIVYAAYSQSLTINGTANVKANSWNIHFANLGTAQLTGEAQEVTSPTINTNDTNIGDFSVLLSKPGDKIKYTFDIGNEGTFDAITSLIYAPTNLTCTGTGDNAEQDAANVCKHLHYNFNIPGSAVTNGQIENGQLKLDKGAKIEAMSIELVYDADVPVEDLPKNDVAISGLNAYITFVQR